jgi:hypothetical protein
VVVAVVVVVVTGGANAIALSWPSASEMEGRECRDPTGSFSSLVAERAGSVGDV